MRWGKKAQGAMEFLMTYGWALLIVLVAIGTLVIYFGVDSNFLANEGCYMQPGFFCSDHRADEGSVMVNVANSLGRDLAEVSVSQVSCSLDSDNPSLDDDDEVFLTVKDCSFGVAGDYLDEQLNLTYRFLDSTIYHSSDFKIGAIIEGGNSQGIGGGGNSEGGNPGGSGTGYQSDNQTVLLLKFEENSGTVAYDSSSYGNDGTLNGDAFRGAGYFGTGIELDGDEDFVKSLDADSLDFPTESFTVELWIKTSVSNLDSVIYKKGTRGYALGIIGGMPAFEVRDNSGFVRLIASAPIDDDTWHHVAFVIDRDLNEMRSYTDGLSGSTIDISSIGDIDNSIALKVGKGLNELTGTLDEVRISDFARY